MGQNVPQGDYNTFGAQGNPRVHILCLQVLTVTVAFYGGPVGYLFTRSNPDSYFQGNPRVPILPLQVLTVTLLFTKLPCCVLLAGTFFRGVFVSVNFVYFSPSRFSHFHCNAMRKAIKVHKNLHTNQQNEYTSETVLPFTANGLFSILYGTVGNYGTGVP